MRKHILFILTTAISGCSWLIDHEVATTSPIKFKCSKKCITIESKSTKNSLTNIEKRKIEILIRSYKKQEQILISACNTQSEHFAILIHNYISTHYHKKIRLVNNTLPAVTKVNQCVNFVRGKIRIMLPNCTKYENYKPTSLVNKKFGCANNYNLVKMIRDPNDFFIGSGVGGQS